MILPEDATWQQRSNMKIFFIFFLNFSSLSVQEKQFGLVARFISWWAVPKFWVIKKLNIKQTNNLQEPPCSFLFTTHAHCLFYPQYLVNTQNFETGKHVSYSQCQNTLAMHFLKVSTTLNCLAQRQMINLVNWARQFIIFHDKIFQGI